MNYHYAFHKHAVLARILTHLAQKSAAFRVIAIHANAGRYDLASPEASRSGEWRDGIDRLTAATSSAEVTALQAPYRDAVARANPAGTSRRSRPCQSRRQAERLSRLAIDFAPLIACELEPNACAALKRILASDARGKAVAIDGFTALKAYAPPKERRGLVLIDPLFEFRAARPRTRCGAA